MSVSVHLSITVRGYDPPRATAVTQAIQGVIEHEPLETYLAPVEEEGQSLVTQSDPDNPIIVSRADKWERDVTQALSNAVEKANGGPCEVLFELEDADDAPDYEVED